MPFAHLFLIQFGSAFDSRFLTDLVDLNVLSPPPPRDTNFFENIASSVIAVFFVSVKTREQFNPRYNAKSQYMYQTFAPPEAYAIKKERVQTLEYDACQHLAADGAAVTVCCVS